MPLYMIERNFVEGIQPSAEAGGWVESGGKIHEFAGVKQINAEVGVHWLFSFLSADKKKTYCLYEAESPEAIREAARRLNIPADVIIEVGEVPSDSPVTKWPVVR